jgi:DNA-binding CsgD family transcriptional regulator
MQANEHLIVELTDAQREVLRLVSEGYKSKEIAHRLGIGVDAVNKRIAAAKSTLGAPSRFAAARQLAAFEARSEASHSLVSQTLAIADEAAVGNVHRREVAEEFVDDRSSGLIETDESLLGFPLLGGRAMYLDAHGYQHRGFALGQGSA